MVTVIDSASMHYSREILVDHSSLMALYTLQILIDLFTVSPGRRKYHMLF